MKPAGRMLDAVSVRQRRQGSATGTRPGQLDGGASMSTTSATAVDADLGLDPLEQYYKGDERLEHQAIEDLVGVIHKGIERKFSEKKGLARRDAHAGDTGCVRAFFRVDADLAKDLQHGVFVPGEEYEA